MQRERSRGAPGRLCSSLALRIGSGRARRLAPKAHAQLKTADERGIISLAMRRRGSSWALMLAALACGGTPEPSELSVVLGTGQAMFEPMEGEPELTLVAGTQGGFHVWASFLAY